VRTRTYLTTPPGSEPTSAVGGRDPDAERYVPALELPREPRVPSRHRRAGLAAAALLTVAVVAFVLVRLGAAAQSEDPALSEPTASQDG
jgi:hypothetical protein